MQWVETTGRTIEDAKEAALDQLGIDESEAEFEVLEEPKTGLFGRPRGEARIRARVVPKTPRPKQERRPRRQRTGKGEGGGGNGNRGGSKAEAKSDGTSDAKAGAKQQPSNKDRRGRGDRTEGNGGGRPPATKQEGNQMTDEDVPVGTQADIISEFLDGLLDAMGAEGTISRTEVDEETIELAVDGSDLGLLIGPKGQTLTAVHELSRTVLQRRATGRHVGRVRIDIGGYRQRRAEALARFVRQQADAVLESGAARALEPMNSADRKVVHDTVNEIEGVSTISEGADPQRRVVIVPEGADA
ncbi:MAG: RNA-binding cell elongation regulator Jag/EloR [Acidimicrobiales bacterium]